MAVHGGRDEELRIGITLRGSAADGEPDSDIYCRQDFRAAVRLLGAGRVGRLLHPPVIRPTERSSNTGSSDIPGLNAPERSSGRAAATSFGSRGAGGTPLAPSLPGTMRPSDARRRMVADRRLRKGARIPARCHSLTTTPGARSINWHGTERDRAGRPHPHRSCVGGRALR
jgi:hypothetical protein